MFTNVMFYFAWVALALFPLVIAILAPQTVKGKNYCLLVCADRHLWVYRSNIHEC